MPVTSPIAQRRSPARRWSSTGDPRAGSPRRRPSRGRSPPRASAGRLPPAAGRRAAPYRRRRPGRTRHPRAGRAVACVPSISSMPSRRSASLSAWPSGGSLAGQHAASTLDDHRLPPSRRTTCPISTPPTRRRARAGGAGPPSCSSPRGCPRRPRGHAVPGAAARPDPRRSPGRCAPRCAGCHPRPPRRPGQPARAPEQVDAAAPPASAPGRHRDQCRHHGSSRQASAARNVHLCGRGGLPRAPHRLARAQQRLRRKAAQYEHSPPTSSRSMTATRSPRAASAAAQCSPGAPPPRTITS